MTRRFLVVTVGLSATVAFLVGLIVAGSMSPAPATATTAVVPQVSAAQRDTALRPDTPGVVSFADVAERLNPAVVNIDATARGPERGRRGSAIEPPGSPDLFQRPQERDPDGPRRGAGTGFVIDADGHILTNHHVIDGADRIMVRLADGRVLRAERVGSDPDTDIALIRVTSSQPLVQAALGDSDTLRVGEWVVAIGNPLAYEHTVTVGVVSFIGRKLFDSSLDRYIQTDAAINFGNSGGPLINARGEVIGINSAISSRAANIGFAVPINQARAILPQLKATGRVVRGYIGVALRDVDPDLQRALGLPSSAGALVQDVTAGSPGQRAGLRAYDLIVGSDGAPVADNDELIQRIAATRPGATVTLSVVRDGRALDVPVKLAERPSREAAGDDDEGARTPARPGRVRDAIGLSVRDIDPAFASRVRLPDGTRGVIVSRVETTSPAFDAAIERGHVLLEVNRQPVLDVDEYRRLVAAARPGDVLTLYIYKPEIDQRTLLTVKVDDR
ncbi:MAG: trypsin-like peptidase domain-containing protein [Vicinamibacterales bacterium]